MESYNPVLHKVMGGSSKGGSDGIVVLGINSVHPKVLGHTNNPCKMMGSTHSNLSNKKRGM